MAEASSRIGQLSPETRAQIQSSVQITSLTQVVLELVKNSLDAQARRLEIRLDFMKGFCSVLDDGDGILRDEYLQDGGLARPYFTSRTEYPATSHGRYGRFLASLASLSVLTITSCHRSSDSVNTMILRDGDRVTTSIDTGERQDFEFNGHGTKVVVHDLFGKMPVRVKQRLTRFASKVEADGEYSMLKTSVIALMLAAVIPFSVDLRETGGTRRFVYKPPVIKNGRSIQQFDLGRITSILSQAGLANLDTNNWRTVSARNSTSSVYAAFSLEPNPTKEVQFMAINSRPILDRSLFEEVNKLFVSSTFGYIESHVIMNRSRRKLRGSYGYQRKHLINPEVTPSTNGYDRWPMFVIKIVPVSAAAGYFDDLGTSHITCRGFQSTISLLRSLVIEFLEAHGHHTKKTFRRSHSVKKEVTGTDGIPTVSYDINSFQRWSRIKSTRPASRSDILSGLPFLDNNDVYGITNTSTSIIPPLKTHVDTVSNNIGTDGASVVEWTNPYTEQVLKLDARTGMAMPNERSNYILDLASDSFASYSKLTTRRGLQETAESLVAAGFTTKHPETTITSVANQHEAPSAIHLNSRHICSSRALDETAFQTIPPDLRTEPVGSRISRQALRSAKVIGQVDDKFILLSIHPNETAEGATVFGLVDQHAADERIRIEHLYHQICNCSSITLPSPIAFVVTTREANLFREHQEYLASWKIQIKLEDSAQSIKTVSVIGLPETIAERCRVEPKLLIELLKKVIRDTEHRTLSIKQPSTGDWPVKITTCPRGILDMLASRACRSSIMFNDVLSNDQCKELISKLGNCLFPFQCAHGRPSMSILARLRGLDETGGSMLESTESRFSQGWQSWSNSP